MEAIQGKKLVYLYRILSEANAEAGVTLAFTTENSRTTSKDADSTSTKDGSIRTPGTAEVEISATSILAKDDVLVGKLEQALEDDALIEIWEANLDEPVSGGNNKYKGRYYQGYLTEIEYSSPSDEFIEVTLSFGINGVGKAGEVTVPPKQADAALYQFKDSIKASA